MKIDLTKTNGSSPPADELSTRIRQLWQIHFPSIELTNTGWFEKYDFPLLDLGFRITADKISSGREFEALDEKNVGKYAVRVIQNLRNAHSAQRCGKGWRIGCSVWIQAGYHITQNDRDRFKSRLARSGNCLLFKGAKTNGGYGRFSIKSRSINAHFFAFFSENGGYLPAPNALGGVNGLQVAHSCRNRHCCYVGHLSLTTKGVNLSERDRYSIHPAEVTVGDDYGSENGSVPSRCSSINPDVSQGPPCNDPLADPSIAQRGVNRPSSGDSSFSISKSHPEPPVQLPKDVLGSAIQDPTSGVTGGEEITI